MMKKIIKSQPNVFSEEKDFEEEFNGKASPPQPAKKGVKGQRTEPGR